jgi:uncharacterized protein YggE
MASVTQNLFEKGLVKPDAATNAIHAVQSILNLFSNRKFKVKGDVAIHSDDEKNAGPIIDAIVVSSGDGLVINSVSPFVLETTKATAAARTAAVKSAKTKASAYAKLLGVRLGKVAYLNENSSPVYTGPVYAMAKDSVAATQIDLGQQEITVTVEVRWNIS